MPGSDTQSLDEGIPPFDDPPRSVSPKAIGPYRMLELIGEGGMGEVYLAEQTEPVRRRVALKLIRPGMDTKEVVARFEAERQALALMSHPAIARILDAGSADGRPYFVMEHVAGVPLTEYCDRHRLSIRERLELFAQVCDAVQHAHQKAIIHRDLKPSNVLVTVDGGRPSPRIIDFGIAKATNQRLTEQTLFTEIGQIVGTPEYMSPEQAERGALDVDTRTDVYSLGVILYELLTGELPFSPKELREAGYAALQRIIREKEPPRPSTRLSTLGESSRKAVDARRTDLDRLLRELRGDLDWIVMKAMEKDRTRRYGAASDLAADVNRHLRREPVLARPPSMTYRLTKLFRRHRSAVAVTAVLLITLVGGLAATSVMYFRSEDQRTEKEKALGEKSQALIEKTAALGEREKALEATTEALGQKEAALRRSEGQRLTMHASDVLPANPGLSLLLAIEGAQRAPGAQANNALSAALLELHEVRRLPGKSIWSYFDKAASAVSPDRSRVVTAAESGDGLQVWNTATGALSARLTGEHFAGFSRDTSRAATHSGSRTSVWDMETGREIASMDHQGNPPSCAAFSPDGAWLVTASSFDETARIWKVDGGRMVHALTGHKDGVICAAFSPDGTRVVTGSEDATARIWDAASGKEVLAFERHPGTVFKAVFSADGSRVVTTGQEGTDRLWDAATAREILVLKHAARIFQDTEVRRDGSRKTNWTLRFAETSDATDPSWGTEIATESHCRGPLQFECFHEDGSRFLTVERHGGGPGVAQVWDATTGEVLVTLAGHDGSVQTGAFSPSGSRIVTTSDDGTARLWDAREGSLVTVFAGHDGGVDSAAFSRDGDLVVTVSSDDFIARVWNVFDRKPIATLRGHEAPVHTALFNRDGSRVVTFSSDGTTRLWNVHAGRGVVTPERRKKGLLGLFAPPLPPTDTVIFSPDGSRFVPQEPDATIRMCDAATGKEVLSLRGHRGQVFWVAFSRDGTRLVTGAADGTARIWDAANGKELARLERHRRGVSYAVFVPDGSRVLTVGYEDRTARTWDGWSGKLLAEFEGHGGPVRTCVLSADGLRALTTSESDETARIWDSGTGRQVHELKHDSKVEAAWFLGDGSRVLSSDRDHTVWLWDAAGGEAFATLKETSSSIRQIAIASDGSRFLWTTSSGACRLWDSSKAVEVANLAQDGSEVTIASFSPDGERVVTVDRGRARLWSSKDGKEVVALRGNARRVSMAAFSPDGSRLAAASEDNTVRVWDARTGEEILVFRGHRGPVLYAQFTPDGRRIVSATAAEGIRIWPVDPMEAALEAKPRELTPDEVDLYEIGTPEERARYRAAHAPGSAKR